MSRSASPSALADPSVRPHGNTTATPDSARGVLAYNPVHGDYNTAGPAASLLHGHQDEGRPPAFQLAAPAQPRLRATNPGVVNLDLAMQRLANSVDHGAAQFVERGAVCGASATPFHCG